MKPYVDAVDARHFRQLLAAAFSSLETYPKIVDRLAGFEYIQSVEATFRAMVAPPKDLGDLVRATKPFWERCTLLLRRTLIDLMKENCLLGPGDRSRVAEQVIGRLRGRPFQKN